jgi:predicted phosphodiesterase
VKILAISDVVLPQLEDCAYLRRSFSEAELIVSCGDLPVAYLDFVCSSLNLPLFFVRGNHDTSYVPPDPGGDNLHRRFFERNGFRFAGLEGSILYSRQGVIQYTERDMLFQVLSMLPRLLMERVRHSYGVDVMVTH